jgi:hypothetical protein
LRGVGAAVLVLGVTPWVGLASSYADDTASPAPSATSSPAAAAESNSTPAPKATSEPSPEATPEAKAEDKSSEKSSGQSSDKAADDTAKATDTKSSDKASSDKSSDDKSSDDKVTEKSDDSAAKPAASTPAKATRAATVKKAEALRALAADVPCVGVSTDDLSIPGIKAPGAGATGWGATVSTKVTVRNTFNWKNADGSDCSSITISLASYETQGATWPTSGTQTFIDHDVITLTPDQKVATLTVDAPRCFGQIDLYFGSVIYDGGQGPLHGPAPHYPVQLIPNKIGSVDGGQACAVPSAVAIAGPCTNGVAVAPVILATSAGFGETTFEIWAKTGDGAYAKVGSDITLAASGSRTVNVPLVEDTPVTIQVRIGGDVFKQFGPFTADCAPTPSATALMTPCVDGVANAVVTLKAEGTQGSSTFRVQAKTGDGAYSQVGSDVTVAAGGTSTVNVPLVEDTPVTIQVLVGGEVLETFTFTADCAPPPPVTPNAVAIAGPCTNGVALAPVILSASEGTGSITFEVWAKTGDADYAKVGSDVTLTSGGSQTVNVPLVEDTPVTIQVRIGGDVFKEFGPFTTDCVPTPSATSVMTPCVEGVATAVVTLKAEGTQGSSTFRVQAKTGDGAYAAVGPDVVVNAGATQTVTVPLVEDTPVTIQVLTGDTVLNESTFTADCVAPPVIPTATVAVNPCVGGVSTATVTLAVSAGSGEAAFTVWAKTADGAYVQVGGPTTLPNGLDRTATATVPLVEDEPVTIQVRNGADVVETFAPITANCLTSTTPPPPPGGTGVGGVKIPGPTEGETGVAGVKIPGVSNANQGSTLPRTGAEALGLLVAVSLGLTLAGATLLLLSRRRTRTDG